MGNFKSWWIFGFERWGGLRPASVTTKKGVVFIPLFWGLWLRKAKGRKICQLQGI
jgi:hypothetical protein